MGYKIIGEANEIKGDFVIDIPFYFVLEEEKMRITDIKINGSSNPIGFSYPKIKCSWKVVDTANKSQLRAKIMVAKDVGFTEQIFETEGELLSSIGTLIDIKPEPYTRYYVRIEVWGKEGDHTVSAPAFFETGKMDDPWRAEFISTKEEDKFHPIFIKNFSRPSGIKRACIYLTGLGLYEAYLNGKKIGDDFLAPFINDYRTRVQYQTYDITELLEDDNRIEILCGNGFYKGRFGYEGDVEYFGNRFGIIAEIHMWDKAGHDILLGTDNTWEYRGSEIAESDIYDGEIIDRMLWSEKENRLKSVEVADFDKSKLVERYSITVCPKEELEVKEIIKTPKGETVLDFGQNFTGYVSFDADFAKGTKIVLDFGEILQDDNFYNDNYRTAKSQFVYISDGRKENVRPHFTYFGFRYVRVTGWNGEITKKDFTGHVVYSDLDTTIKFESADEKLNRLFLNCIWSQKSNFLDHPTDCPQRDERLGWTGDAQVFASTACFNMDTRAFYRKFLRDLRTEQVRLGGAIPNYIPNNSSMPGGSSVWGDAATFIPMAVYNAYGDKDELECCYPMMKDWVDWIIQGDEEHGNTHLWSFGFHFGDWLAQDGVTSQSMKGGTDDYYIASVYYYASTVKLAEAAKILGKNNDRIKYEMLAEKIVNAILDEYFSVSGRLCIDTQTAYLISLKFGVYKDKKKILDGLKSRLKRDCYKIKGGFVGAPMMCQVLAENGMIDMAYYILFQEGFPGWMHCVNLGATTIWERWNSVLDNGMISGTEMNSLNHYSYGSVMEFVYRYIGGINAAEPGFTRVRFVPKICSKLQFCHIEYDSLSGKYVSDWRVNADGTVTVHFEVPFHCEAVAILPGTNGREVMLTAGIYEETYQPNVDYRRRYTMATRIQELRGDEEALSILKEDLPIVYGLAVGNDEESHAMSFEELQFMFFFGLDPQMIQEGTKRVFELTV